MDLKRLRYFCAIVEHGQISKAAQALNMAQPPLSLRLKELEEEFSVQLIQRGSRGCVPTEAGRRLYERARMVLSEIDGLTEEMKSEEGDDVSYIVIGVSSTCASFLRAPLLRICGHHPRLILRVLLGDSTWLETMLRDRCIDFALMQTPEDSTGLLMHRLPKCRFAALVPERLIPADWPTDRLKLEHIARFPLLVLRRSSGTGFYERFLRLMHSRGLKPKVIMDCPDVRVLRDACSSGMNAVTLLPESELRDYRPHQVRPFILDEPDIFFIPLVARLANQQPSRDVQMVMDSILESEAAANAP